MNRVAVDLFGGTGGATAAFRGRPGWTVVSVELDPVHRPDVVADVRRLPVGRADFLWASPPCTEFSTANPRVDHATKRPSLELVTATLEAVAELRPRFWIMENVRGAIPFLGIPAQKIGPWCLWGYFPRIEVTAELQDHRKWGKSTAVERAAVPRAMSEAVADAVEQAWELTRILDLRTIRRHRHIRRAAVRPGRTAQGDLWT